MNASADLGTTVLAAAADVLGQVRPLVRAADPARRVSARSEVLCAGLATLAGRCHAALGGDPRLAPQVLRAAGLLSLLTKVDDEVIDALEFHGGPAADRDDVRARTRAFLDVTLSALEAGASGKHLEARGCARSALAYETGRSLRALAGEGVEGRARLARLVALVRRGWEIQVDGVCAFSASPGHGPREAVDRVTGEISGAWLLMITRVGALSPDVARDLTDDEDDAFFVDAPGATSEGTSGGTSEGWGAWIQRADALCDLEKDVDAGFVQTWAGRLAWEADPVGWDAVAARRDGAAAGALVRRRAVDLACLPSPCVLDALEARLSGLGSVPRLLRWIHAFLTWRWVVSPAARALPDPRLAPWLATGLDGQAYAIAAEAIARALDRPAREEVACSAR